MFEVKVIAHLKHNFSSEAKPASVSRESKNDEIQQTVEQWFERFLGRPRPTASDEAFTRNRSTFYTTMWPRSLWVIDCVLRGRNGGVPKFEI